MSTVPNVNGLTLEQAKEANVIIEVVDGKAMIIKDRFSSHYPREITQEQLAAFISEVKNVVVCNFKVR